MGKSLIWILTLPTVLVGLLLTNGLTGCFSPSQSAHNAAATPSSPPPAAILSTDEVLDDSWSTYKARFIQRDGRVIDREVSDRSLSEGQAYAMLRSVLADDPDTFALTLEWAENNLQRQLGDRRSDRLWAWKWGQDSPDHWGVIEQNFASDADVDGATALILAARRWNRPDYLALAQTKLKDLWALATVEVSAQPGSAQKIRYLLPGPAAIFQPQPQLIYLNPSYLAPSAFRLFAQVDPAHDWLSLADSSYKVFSESAALSQVGLPSDWVALNLRTGQFQPLPDSSDLKTLYGFDAYRVWWRVAWDAAWFDAPQAKPFLDKSLPALVKLWRSQRSIPARFDLQGNPTVNYDSTSQYAMLYAAFQIVDPAIATDIRQHKIIPAYSDGLWDHDSAYYSQNLAWLGLFPATEVGPNLLQTQAQK